MTTKPRNTTLGKRIAAWRRQKEWPQILVARRAGIAPSYLSRIERGRVHPTVRTAKEIADALRVPLDDLLQPSPVVLRGCRCPVSASGKCLIDLAVTETDKRSKADEDWYTPRRLRLLRRFAALLQQSSPKMLTALEVLVGEMLGEEKAKKLAPRD